MLYNIYCYNQARSVLLPWHQPLGTMACTTKMPTGIALPVRIYAYPVVEGHHCPNCSQRHPLTWQVPGSIAGKHVMTLLLLYKWL